MNVLRHLVLLSILPFASSLIAADPETLPPIINGKAPQTFEEMWDGFDPRSEPLELEVLKEWEQDEVVLRVVRFRIGVFKGQKASLAAIYGYPKELPTGKRLPGLVQIHGGGQYADHKACLTNAKRGYATVSIAWAGRISAPQYRVTPSEVKLFWDRAVDDPNYRITTDWGAVDGYHAPGRNVGNQFPSAKSAEWTLDDIESPRNSGWYLCAIAARRALTFLEQQPEVDANRLGVYGHSMGGKLTVLAAVDPRVKAAAPSCGGISDRDNASELFRATLGDDVSLANITCPIIFLSPTNDFHGRIGDLPHAISEIKSQHWRVTCSPHHNHQDTAEFEVATQLWMDQHLKGRFLWPSTPHTTLNLAGDHGAPVFTVKPDSSRPVSSVNVFYTTQGKPDERPQDRLDTMHRFWHHATAIESNGVYRAELPLGSVEDPLWVFANVRYQLDHPITGAGYYYGVYDATTFNLSSLLTVASPKELADAGTLVSLAPTTVIEDFEDGWENEWFRYGNDANAWQRRTNKLNSELFQPPTGARLTVDVRSERPNKFVVRLDDFVAEVDLKGGDWQTIQLSPTDLKDSMGNPANSWDGFRQLRFSDVERLRNPDGGGQVTFGQPWQGPAPGFRRLRWTR